MEDQTNTTNQSKEVFKLLRVHHDIDVDSLADALSLPSNVISGLEDRDSHFHPGFFGSIHDYSDYFNIPVSSIIYIAEHLESARQGQGSFRHCRAADLILQIELAKAELKNEKEQ